MTLGAGVVLCIAGLAAAALLVAGAARRHGGSPESPASRVRPAVPTGTARVLVSAPVEIAIQAIHVDAPIERIGLTPADNVDVPSSPTAAGWYDLGPSPGQPGDAIIVGHLDTAEGDAVFAQLHRLHPGDGLTVTLADGRRVGFTVSRLTYYPYSSPPPAMYATTGPAQLSLVTCAGRWDARLHTYLQRLVVTAQPSG